LDTPNLTNFDTSPWVEGNNPGMPPTRALPLERYYPPYQEGMVENWVRKYVAPGSYLLDPFGQNPFTALELARSGYRVLVSANNPIAVFTLKVLASAPTAEDFSQALHQLNQNKMRDGSSLEEYLSNFYRINCPNPECDAPDNSFEVDIFLWKEDGQAPHIAIGACSNCGLEGEIELTPALLESAGRLPSYALIRSQVLERVAGQDPPLRRIVEEVISFYNPRALIALQILLTKIETSNLSLEHNQLLTALWLSTADQVNQLWIWPRGRNRPRQLLRPPVYQETNVWKAFLHAWNSWVQPEPQIKLRDWPKRVPPEGGISLFEGRLRELDTKPEPGLISLVQTSLPRRNQAWWNLSGLWSGWLWGKDGVKTIRNSLLKQRYDWTWHSVALKKVLSQLPNLIGKETPVLLLTSELDSMFILAGSLGARSAGLSLSSASIDGENEALQTVWRLQAEMDKSASTFKAIPTFQKSGMEILNKLGEPAHWLRLLSYSVFDQLVQGKFDNRPVQSETLNDIEAEIASVFNQPRAFRRFNPGTTPESGLYWFSSPPKNYTSLADEAESVILSELLSRQQIGLSELLDLVHSHLTGLLTPPLELITEILNSYGQPLESSDTKKYQILPHETATNRRDDLIEIRKLIEQMADKLDFRRELLPDRIVWLDQIGNIRYSFFPITTAQISRILVTNQDLPGQKVIVLPGSRSNLIAYKLKRDPNLRLLKGEDWQLVKFRQLRNLATNPLLSRELFNTQITGDPPEFHTAQLALF